jgi:paraquat-inducible protein B
MSSHESLDTRLTELTRQLDQKDTELDQEVDEIVEADLDALDRDIEETNKGLRDDLRQRVEAVNKAIKDRKDDLRQRVEAAKKAPKDHARKEAEQALNRMQEDLSKEDLVSAHIDRWVANQWLKVSK